jgi:hypothetical protein
MASVTPDVKQGTLVALIRAMYPHDSFPDGPYERSAEAITAAAAADHRISAQLGQGLAELDAAGFDGMDAAAKLAHLHTISATTFFQSVRGEVITSLYNDPEVWGILGWEGESFSKGGYLERGFDDLDWLPAARIEEAGA